MKAIKQFLIVSIQILPQKVDTFDANSIRTSLLDVLSLHQLKLFEMDLRQTNSDVLFLEAVLQLAIDFVLYTHRMLVEAFRRFRWTQAKNDQDDDEDRGYAS